MYLKVSGMFKKYLFFLVILISLLLQILSGASQADQIVELVQKRYQNIRNFQCLATLSLNVPNIRMPARKIKINYKKPDEIKVQSEGFSIVPGFNFLPLIMMSPDSADYYYDRKEKLDTATYHIIQMESPKLPGRTDFWIDSTTNSIIRLVATDTSQYFTHIDIYYDVFDNYLLPDSIFYSFHLNKSIPEFSPPSINRPFGETQLFKKFSDKKVEGSIELKIDSYQINSPVIDSLFTRKKNENHGQGDK